MKNFTSRMASLLLLCGALFTSTTAKAETGDETVVVNIVGNEGITDGVITGTVNSMTVGNNTAVEGDHLRLGHLQSNIVTLSESQRAGYGHTSNLDKVIVSFDISIGNANGLYGAVYLKDADGENIAYFCYGPWNPAVATGTNLGLTLDTNLFNKTNNGDWSNKTHFDIEIDYQLKKIVTKYSGFATNATGIEVGLDNAKPIATIEIASGSGNAGDVRRTHFGNLIVTNIEGDYSVQLANYTVKFMSGENEIKEASARENATVGSNIVIAGTDKETFYSEDGSKKYVYLSDDASEVSIKEDGTSVITVQYTTYEKYTYTLNAVYGATNLKELATDDLYEDETLLVYYPLAIQKDGKWYTTKQNAVQPYYGVTVTKDDATKAIEYDLNADVDYFFEGNELTIAEGNWATVTGAPNMMSSGDASRMAPNSKVYTPELAAGTYQMTIVARNQRAKAGETETVTLLIRSSEGEFTPSALEIPTWQSAGGFGANVVNDIVIAEGESLALGNLTEYNSNIEIDYIILKNQDTQKVAFKLGNATDSYASFVPARDADFEASGVKAYIVTEITEDEVVMKEVKTAKAGTPVLLKGTKDDVVTIQVAEAAADAEGNLLKAATGEGVGSAYVLSYVDDEWAFRSYTGETLSAGKVYLAVPTEVKAEALGLQIGTATAIKTLAAPAAKGAIYTIAGQRVSSMKKAGLYIAGGKKVAVK